MIGQSQVTQPLMTALRTNRVNHAYLFSGPRGCGKTTSARILARCLNCAEGPTDTPCGVCPSCVELSRDGGGSLDVVEIDAASHNGVDDARDLRERAVYAPARDRYKIFILDEAHMVTPQGFNALLKLVEEPPEHVKFIFATTEPEKVIGTIRSRTHHYPFRLIAPATMLEYVEKLCVEEGVAVDPGVLPLVVRAGGGSARDTLSILDQIMAGSEGMSLGYERAVALLGYTHASLLNEAVNALAAHDSAAAFAAVDRVIQTGQDPRRFVEDLLERLRDLIIVAATHGDADALLRGVPSDEIAIMQGQARAYGAAALSRTADIANEALTGMVGATSPKLHLELMIARMLVESAPAHIGAPSPAPIGEPAPAAATRVPAPAAAPVSMPAPTPATASVPYPAPTPATAPEPVSVPVHETPVEPAKPARSAEPATTRDLLEAWSEICAEVNDTNAMAGLVVLTAQVRELNGDVLTLVFPSESDAAKFRPQPGMTGGVHEILRDAISGALGVTVKFRVSVEGTLTAPITTPVTQTQPRESTGASKREFATPEPAQTTPQKASDDGWAVVAIPGSEPASEPDAPTVTGTDAATGAASSRREPELEPTSAPEPVSTQYGESLVRQLLGATFIKDEVLSTPITPSDTNGDAGSESDNLGTTQDGTPSGGALDDHALDLGDHENDEGDR